MFLIVDIFSKWLEVKIMNATTALATVEVVRRVFAIYGLTGVVVTNNGPQFRWHELERFLLRME